MSISLDLYKRLGDFTLELALDAGDEVLALLGASGCGKSMTLKCIAGIQRPDRGHIEVDGVTLFDSARRIDLSPQKRRTGLMFQNYALFPNMTVEQNIRAGARREKDAALRQRQTAELMERFGLTGLAGHYPAQLSGGQQQRTALARLLVSGPNVLLLDEPFSALDSHLRFRMERELRQVVRSFGKTVVLVSHDRDEVFRLSDRIAVMNSGRVEVCGTRDEVFAAPRTRTAALLTGCKNISPVEVLDSFHVRALDWDLVLETAVPAEGARYVGIRMHNLSPDPGPNTFDFTAAEELENPFSFTVMLRRADRPSAGTVGWELDKDLWRSRRAPAQTVSLPPRSLSLLQE